MERNQVAVLAEVGPLVGRSLNDFSKEAARLGYVVHVVKEDGVSKGMIFDYRPSRVNVIVENHKVVEIFSVR